MTRTGQLCPALLPTGWWATGLRGTEREQAGAPGWVLPLERALVLAPCSAGPAIPTTAAGTATFVGALEPLVRSAAADLAALLDGRGLPIGAATAALRSALRGRLTETAARTLVVELHAARQRGELVGADPRTRFAEFVAATATAPGLARLFTTYPVLARLLGQICTQEVAALAELSERFAADRAAIVATLLAGHDPGAVTAVELGGGDRHAGGRAVAILTFADGARTVYKPRPVGLHQRFAELVGVLDAAAPGLAPGAAASIVRGGYGWVEFMPAATCLTVAEVERYHRRQGALLALLHTLDATDAHYENIIAAGEFPVLIDVETLLHPTRESTDMARADPALRAITASVARTAMLPRPVLGDHGALDVSAMGAGSGGTTPDEMPCWVAAGTDRMRLVRKPVRFAGATSGPTLRGERVDPRRHAADLLAGFRAAYEVLRAAGPQLLAADGAIRRCSAEEARYILRDTATYVRFLAESTHPDLMRDAAEREHLFTLLAEDAPAPALVAHEIADLWAGDVPMFTVRPGARAVAPAQGAPISDVLPEPVLDRVARTVADMGPADLERQEWMIRATLALASPVEHRAAAGTRRPGATPATTGRLLAAASALGDELIATAATDGERVNWVGMQQVDDRYWAVLPLGAGLGAGYPGVALFLAQLGQITGIPRYTQLARRAVAPLPWLVSTLADPERAAAVGCGAFAGIGGICYALARLSTLLHEPALRDLLPDAIAATMTAARGTAAAPAGDTAVAALDTGLAGGVAALLAVAAETGLGGCEAAELARLLAHRARSVDTPGMLTGRAGVDWALRRAGLPVLATTPSSTADAGWCTGDLLAAVDAGLPSARAEVLATAAPLAGHALCHGEAGTLDALAELDARHGTALRHERGAAFLAAVADGPQCATPAGLPVPGFLTGIAGIGHTLLRLAHPDSVPSVLLLDAAPGTGNA